MTINDREGALLKAVSLTSIKSRGRCYLFSVEQKKDTQGLRLRRSEVGGRYMASEKQVRSSFSSSVLQEHTHTQTHKTYE